MQARRAQEPEEADFDISFETEQILDSINFVEFKLNEINALIQECIDQQYEEDILSDVKEVKQECAGLTYQILYQNYNDGLRKLKDMMIQLMRLKFQ